MYDQGELANNQTQETVGKPAFLPAPGAPLATVPPGLPCPLHVLLQYVLGCLPACRSVLPPSCPSPSATCS